MEQTGPKWTMITLAAESTPATPPAIPVLEPAAPLEEDAFARPPGGTAPPGIAPPTGGVPPVPVEPPLGELPPDTTLPPGNRPPGGNQPPGGNRPPQDNRPPGGNRPPQDNRPPGGNRPPQDNRPPGGNRPPQDNRPPGGNRPPTPRPPAPHPPAPRPPAPRPPAPRPPAPRPPAPQPPVIIVPPINTIPPLGELPPLGIVPPSGEIIGRGRCLGPAAAAYAEQIENFIIRELSLRQSFLALADRTNIWKSALTNIAAECLDNARRLASAYYIITGRRYWPITLPAISSRGTFEVELRRLLESTQDLDTEYRVAAGWSTDLCLGALYSILADTKVLQMGQMRTILQYY